MTTIHFGKTSLSANADHFWRLIILAFALGLLVAPAATAQSLVMNGGFETGDFTDWTLSGGGDIYVDNGADSGTTPHSGNYEAEFGTPGELGYISQNLATTPGATYLLSFWLNSPDGDTPNEFQVSWNGTVLFDAMDLPAIGWTNLEFAVTATGGSTVVQFGAQDDSSYLALDDVSVVANGGGAGGHVNIAHYTFDNSGSLGQDSSGHGNDLDYYSYWGPVFQSSTDAEAGSGAVQFFGTSSMDAGNQVLTNLDAVLAGSFTFSAWVKTTVTNGADDDNAFDGAVIFWAYNDQGNTNDTIPLAITGSKAAFTTRDHLGNSTTLHSDSSVNDGNYHLITVTRDQTTGEKKMYVDGNFETSEIGTTDPLNGDTYDLNIGGDPYYTDDTGTNFSSYNGLLDDVQIYTGVLSATNVADLFNHPGTTVADVSGNNQDFNGSLGTSNLDWTTSGDTSWFVETTNTDNGSAAAAQSGSVTNNQSSTLSVTVAGPGTLTFYWSSIANDPNDGFYGAFYLNGNLYDSISGDSAWSMETFNVPAGTSTLTWIAYAGGDSDPTEAAFLDQVSFVSTPSLTASATPQAGLASLTVQFSTPGQDTGGFTVTNWNWNFGDGSTGTGQNPTHVYLNPGVYFPSLVADSTYGSSPLPIVYAFTAITVTNPPDPFFKTLYSFTDATGSPATNTDGIGPNGGLVLSGNTLFGTTSQGGASSYGTLFAINTDLTGFTNLHSFNAGDGTQPNGDLVLSGNTLFGTTSEGGMTNGGSIGFGTVFAVGTNGTGFTNMYNFPANVTSYGIGADPAAGLCLVGNILYGTTPQLGKLLSGGFASYGTVFTLPTNGTNITDLYKFPPTLGVNGVNSGGASPVDRLIFSDGTLYGTTLAGGTSGYGTVFSMSTNYPGSVHILHYFSLLSADDTALTNSDGAFPFSGLVLSGNTLYGTTEIGGLFGYGTIFAVNRNTLSFTNLYNFTGGTDGSGPVGGLTLSGNILYGATSGGVNYSLSTSGTLFAIHTDGTGFETLYSFSGGSDGVNPQGDLLLVDNALYGTTSGGGNSGNGTVFSYLLAVQLNIASAGTNVLLTWPSDVSGYTLQSSLTLGPSAVWNAVSPLPVVVNHLNTVTNAVTATQQFYRLSQ